MAKHRMGDVIVLLPGILGSALARDGKEVWAPSPGAIGRALWSLGRSVRSLQLTDDPWEEDDLGDGVTATRLMPDVHIIPGLWGIDGYGAIARFIQDRFDVIPGQTYVEFPYDWRRDNRAAARQLKRLADEKLHAQRQHNPDAKLVLVGHSMGGLVSRYYLECLDGWKDTRRLITFGTPYRGSLNALDFLANGFVKKLGPLKVADLTDLLRSLTSVYQLLPVYPCVELGNGYERVAELDGRVPGVDHERANAALTDFHRAIEGGVAGHEPRPYDLHAVVGITQQTKQSARWTGDRLLIEETYARDGADEDLGGDGTVPRPSATPIETDDWAEGFQPMYASDRHGSLQNVDPVQTQLLGILTATPLDEFKDVGSIDLRADEVVATDEPFTVRALPTAMNLDLRLVVTDLATERPAQAPLPMRRDADEIHDVEVPPLPAGDYRLHVEGVGASHDLVAPVNGLVCVVEDRPPDVDPTVVWEGADP